MDKLLKEIWAKISSYDLYVNLFPGTVFVLINDYISKTRIVTNNIIVNIVICYFAGFVINRISSIVIEELLKQLHNRDESISFLHRAKYSDYISAAKKDSFIKIMNECNNVFRSFITVFLLLFIVALLRGYAICSKQCIVFLFLMVLFVFSYRKQTKMIMERVNRNNMED